MALLADIRGAVTSGRLPGREIAEAMLVGIAGVLLLTPGYFTDLMGILLLIPPLRTVIYRTLAARFVVVGTPPRNPRTLDLDGDDWRQR